MNPKQHALSILNSLPDDCSHEDIQTALGGSFEIYRETETHSRTREYLRMHNQSPPSESGPSPAIEPSAAYHAWQNLVKI